MAAVEVFGEPTEAEAAAADARRRDREAAARRRQSPLRWTATETRSVIPSKTVEVQTKQLQWDAWTSAAVLLVGALVAVTASISLGAVGTSTWESNSCTVSAGFTDSDGTCSHLTVVSTSGRSYSVQSIFRELGMSPTVGGGCDDFVGLETACFFNEIEVSACFGSSQPGEINRYV